jgi:hypothetical protein
MEIPSGFIAIEQYAKDHSSATWAKAMKKVLKKCKGVPLSSTVDGSRALKSCVEQELGLEVSPDLFHPQRDAGRAVVAPLARATSRAEEEALEAARAARRERDGRKRRRRRREAREAKARAKQARQLEEEARGHLLAVSEHFHPVNLETGEIKTVAEVEAELKADFQGLQEVAKQGAVSAKQLEGLAKAKRVMPGLVAYMAFFLKYVELLSAMLGVLGLPREIWGWLFAAAYLELAAKRASGAERRRALRERAEKLRERARKAAARSGIGEALWRQAEEFARRLAELFARSSSAIEGRNGRLSLWRHGQRRLDGKKLAALTVIHNFWIRRADGSTAAERFFEQEQRDLWTELLEKLPYPSRPAAKRRIDPNTIGAAA